MRKRSWSVLALALAGAVTLAACGGSKPSAQPQPAGQPAAPAKAEAPKGPKQVTIGMWSSPNDFSPISNTTTYGSTVYGFIYQPLVVMNSELKFEGRLAEKWDVAPDQSKFTFYLNKKAKWTDGTPVTSKDAIATYEMIAHPDTKTTRRSLIDMVKGLDAKGTARDGKIEGLKAIDDYTLEVTTKTPVDVDSFLERFAANVYILPKAVLDTVKDRKNIDKEDWVLNPKVTNGPFKFVKYVTDQYIEFEKNKEYFLGEPKLDRIFIKIVNQAAFAAAIEKGEVDLTAGAGIGEVPVTEWEKISALPTVTPVVYTAPSYQYMDINAAQPHLNNPKVRQGFAAAINRKLIVDRLLKGQAEILNTPLTSINKYYVKDLQNAIEFNTEKAKKLLQEGGWDFNREITLLTPTGNLVREQSADIIQANLQAAGVKVKIQKVDFPTRQAMAGKGEFEISLVGFSATFDPDFSSQVVSSGAFNYRRLPGAENDNKKYADKQLEELLLKGKGTAKFEERLQIYTEAQKRFIEDLPFIPLYAPKSLNVVNKRVLNAKPGPQGWLGYNSHLWDVTN